MRVVKVILASIAMAFAMTMLIFLAALWIAGPSAAERVWSSPYIIALYPISLFIAARYLR
jgi:hypothetical protein